MISRYSVSIILFFLQVGSLFGQSSENKLIGLEIGTTLLPSVINEQNIGSYEANSTWGVYGKYEFLKRHKIRSTFIWFEHKWSGSEEPWSDEYSGKKFTIGYEFEYRVYRIFSVFGGIEYYHKSVTHEGYYWNHGNELFYGFEGQKQGVGFPFGLMITLWNHIRIGFEIGYQRIHVHNKDRTNGSSFKKWNNHRIGEEGHFVVGLRF